MSVFLRRFLKDQSGATSIEYGLIAMLIAVALVAGVDAIGGRLSSTYNKVASVIP